MKLIDPIAGIADQINEIIRDHPIELLSIQMNFSENQSDISEKDQEVYNLLHQSSNTYELFETFYKTKHPESSLIPADIKEDFIHLVQESSIVEPESL